MEVSFKSIEWKLREEIAAQKIADGRRDGQKDDRGHDIIHSFWRIKQKERFIAMGELFNSLPHHPDF